MTPSSAGPDARPAFRLELPGGRALDLGARTLVQGVLNVTPDSFSDGGRFFEPDAALRRAEALIAKGADVLDVGGESSRPGAGPVSEDEESRRVVPVIEAVRRRFDLPVSIDTVKAEVARRAIDAGADVVNDISALADDAMLPLLRRTGAAAIVMHMRGTPRTMQRDTRYGDLMGEIAEHLRRAIDRAVGSGVCGDKIVVDPGIGFGKSREGNLEILRRLPELRRLGRPVLVGASRKAFIGSTLDVGTDERLEGSLAVAAVAVWQGAHVVRAHDVRETVRVVRMVDAILGGRPNG